MSDQSRNEGAACYKAADAETRKWFEQQWRIWPKRADEAFTTSLAFHHGAIQAYRAERSRDPEVSADLRMNLRYLDREHRQSLTKGENA